MASMCTKDAANSPPLLTDHIRIPYLASTGIAVESRKGRSPIDGMLSIIIRETRSSGISARSPIL